MRSIHLAPVLFVLAAACGNPAPADPDAAPAPDPTTVVADTDVFTETVVTLQPDGTSSTVARPITAAEERAIAARIGTAHGTAEPLIQQDPSCGSGFWLYDQPNYVGNRICFTGAGTAALALYPRQVCNRWFGCRWYTWQITSGSWYDASAASGVLTSIPESAPESENPAGSGSANPPDAARVQIGFSAYQYSPSFSSPPLMTLLLD
jgi:hypothetical protein